MIEVRSPCRLHFGLLAFNPQEPRQFGGVGLMVRRPDVLISVEVTEPKRGFSGEGRMSDRAVAFAEHFARRAVERGLVEKVPNVHIRVRRLPRPHTGLGVGTQLGISVARGLAALIGHEELDVESLAHLVDRGRRSAIGAHGSAHGGLIVDGGKADPGRLSPLVIRLAFPDQWRIVLVRPSRLHGLAGRRELAAFAQLPPIGPELTARMCKLVLLGLAPAVGDRDLHGFGEALFDLQQLAGQCFKTAQGGVYADKLLEEIVGFVREQQVQGVGQSSWGPTLYAVVGDEEEALHLAAKLQRRFDLSGDEIIVTQPDNLGSAVRCQPSLTRVAGKR